MTSRRVLIRGRFRAEPGLLGWSRIGAQAVQARGRVPALAAVSGPAVGSVVVDRSLFDHLTYQKFYDRFSYIPLIHLKRDVQHVNPGLRYQRFPSSLPESAVICLDVGLTTMRSPRTIAQAHADVKYGWASSYSPEAMAQAVGSLRL